MKRIINIFAMAIACASVMYACNDSYGDLTTGYETRFIDVTEVRSDYTAFPATSKLVYNCPEEVTGSSNQAWCTVNKVKEGEFELKLATNKTIISRNAVVSLRTAGGDVVRLPISQRGIVLQTSETIVTIPYRGGTSTVVVDAPLEFEHYPSEEWLTYTVEGNTINIDLPENNSFPRTAFIYISIPELQLSTVVTVDQLGNLAGLELAKKFIGEEGTEIVWYFNPNADNGPDFLAAWTVQNASFKQNELKIGRITVSSVLYQCMRLNLTFNGKDYDTGWRIDMTEGETDDEVVFTLKFVLDGGFWTNDTYFYNNGLVKAFLQNLTGPSANNFKSYRVADADDVDDPTVITFRDTSNGNNWFAVSKTRPTF